MALLRYHSMHNYTSLHQIHMAKSGSDRRAESGPDTTRPPSAKSPAEQFAPLASTFSRRMLVGVGSASLVALGANFAGITSFLLGFSPENGRDLKLDVLYPIKGFSRCIETNEGFEFIYPSTWVRDQTLFYRAIGKAEMERSLDPPPINKGRSKNVNEPIIAFGPPGTNGELNVSVIVSQVPLNFSIEAFGGPKEVGEAILGKIVASSRRPDVKGTLVESTLREDTLKNTKYYTLEFMVESSSFQRHNVAVCCARKGKLFTLNAQSPESSWPEMAYYSASKPSVSRRANSWLKPPFSSSSRIVELILERLYIEENSWMVSDQLFIMSSAVRPYLRKANKKDPKKLIMNVYNA